MLFGQNHFVDLKGVVLVLSKRNITALELKHANPEGPNVNVKSVSSSLDYLWGHVVRGSYDRKSLLVLRENLGGSQVDHSEVAIGLDHQVFGLEVSVDDSLGVEVLQTKDDRSDVESTLVVVQQVDLIEHFEHVDSLYDSH